MSENQYGHDPPDFLTHRCSTGHAYTYMQVCRWSVLNCCECYVQVTCHKGHRKYSVCRIAQVVPIRSILASTMMQRRHICLFVMSLLPLLIMLLEPINNNMKYLIHIYIINLWFYIFVYTCIYAFILICFCRLVPQVMYKVKQNRLSSESVIAMFPRLSIEVFAL